MHKSLLAGLGVTLALACCGDSPATSEGGYEAFLAGDYTGALLTFNTVLAGIEKVGSGHKPAALDRLQALAHLDAERSKMEFLALLEAGMPMNARDLSLIATELFAASAVDEALTLIDEAHQVLPDDELIEALLKKVLLEAKPDPVGLRALCWDCPGYF